MPKVSIIIPNYNHAPYLKQRIESVLNQTYQDFELIILDDRSTDNSKEIINQYINNPKVTHVIFNEINSGSPFKQWQKGLLLAKGKYIWIAESDDYSDKKLLASLLRPFDEYNDLILSYCQSAIVDEEGNFLYLSNWADPLDNEKWKHDHIELASVELRKYLSFRNTIPNASAVVFVKPHDISLLDESCEFKMLGDWIFWRKLLSQPGRISFCSKPYNYFRLHKQTTRSIITKEKELIRLNELKLIVVPALINPFKDNYDWIIDIWWGNRKLLKGTNYYSTHISPVLILRVLWVVFKRVVNKLFRRSKIPYLTN